MESWKVGDVNKSGTYIFPMLGKLRSYYAGAVFPKTQYKNCFVGDLTEEDTEGKILLLYKFSGDLKYIQFEAELMKHPLFERMYEPDNSHSMYVFGIPDEYRQDYEWFKRGKYSHFSPEYKQQIQKFFNLKDDHDVMQVLRKDPKKFEKLEADLGMKIPRDQECSSIPNWDIEYFRDEYKQVKGLAQVSSSEWIENVNGE